MQAGAFHVVWYAMTADIVRVDVVASDTRGQLPQVKSRYIFRSKKKGNCLRSVGRWGLLSPSWGALFVPHTPETPINRDFYRRRPWNFCEKRPKLPLVEMSIRGPKRKNGLTCLSPMGDCLPFWVKIEKVIRQYIHISKNFYLCRRILVFMAYGRKREAGAERACRYCCYARVTDRYRTLGRR